MKYMVHIWNLSYFAAHVFHKILVTKRFTSFIMPSACSYRQVVESVPKLLIVISYEFPVIPSICRDSSNHCEPSLIYTEYYYKLSTQTADSHADACGLV